MGIRKGALFVMRDMQVIWSMEFPCLLVCQSAIFVDSKRDGTEPFNGRREPRWTGRFDISSTGGAFGSVLQRARVMTETTRISAMEIRMRIDDGYGNEPNATVAYLSSLEGSRKERAFELAKNEYLAWLEHKADRYTTVYGYMD